MSTKKYIFHSVRFMSDLNAKDQVQVDQQKPGSWMLKDQTKLKSLVFMFLSLLY